MKKIFALLLALSLLLCAFAACSSTSDQRDPMVPAHPEAANLQALTQMETLLPSLGFRTNTAIRKLR